MPDTRLIREKIAQAYEILDELGVDAWLTLVRETTLAPDPALALIADLDVTWISAFILRRNGSGQGGRSVALVGNFDADNVQRLGVYDRVIAYGEGPGPDLRALLAELDPAQIALNYSPNDVAADGLNHGLYLRLLQILEGGPYAGRLVSAEAIISALRGRKTATEIERIRAAVAVTEKLFDEVEAFVRPGMTQRQIAAFVHRRIDALGLDYAWPRAYNPIVTCGPDSAIGHAAPGDVQLERGHTLHLDLGIRQAGYCSDLQRMWYILDEGEVAPPPDVQRAFDVVRGAIKAGEAALRPGVPGWQVDRAARDFVVNNGFPEYMHALGHLLGRTAHDGATVLGPRWERYAGICELLVEVNNVFTLELHVVIPGRGIMSLEEDVLVTPTGVDYLSRPQTALRLIR